MCWQTEKKESLVKDLVRFCNVPCSRSAHGAICCLYELGSGQGKPCGGLLCRFCILPTVVVPGWVLPEALYPPQGENGAYKDFTEGSGGVGPHLAKDRIPLHGGSKKKVEFMQDYQHLIIWRLRSSFRWEELAGQAGLNPQSSVPAVWCPQ